MSRRERVCRKSLNVGACRSASSTAADFMPFVYRFGPVSRLEFMKDAVLDFVHKREANSQSAGDFFVKQDLRDALDDLPLSCIKKDFGRGTGSVISLMIAFSRIYRTLSRQRKTDCRQKLMNREWLFKISVATG